MSENADFIHSLYGAFSRGDIATILAALAPDVDWVCEGPASVPFCGKFRGPEQVSKFFEALATTQSGHDLKIEETYAAGDQVFTINRYSCVVNVSGKKVDARGVHVFTVKNGKVTRFLEIFDSAAAVDAYKAAPAGASA
jgi:ketosteroid isomerase-like protein